MLSKTKFSSGFQISLGLVLAGAILWFYWSVLVSLGQALSTNEDYSFGLLLPLVSGYIIYLKWFKIRQHACRPSWLGLAIIFLGFCLYSFGDLLAILYFGPISFIVVLTGLLFLLGGRDMVRLCGFPLFLLFFTVPLPSVLMKNLTLPLQLISSWLASGMLRTIGIPLVRQGNVIDLGVRQLQVVDACSGLRYILSLLALGIIYCYFYQRRFWKAAILLTSIIPAAILANAFRVAAMALLPALQEGFWHSFSGWLIFVFCFGLLAFLNWLLNYLWPVPYREAGSAPGASPEASKGFSTSPTPYLLGALVVVFLAGPVVSKLQQTQPMSLVQSFDHFPMRLGVWQGQRAYLDQAMAKAVGADDYLEANFTNPTQGLISLWIAFFESQSKKLEGRIHSPQICLQGSGWKFIESKIVDMAPGKPVRFILMEQGGVRQVVYYWYLQRGRWLASEYSFKLLMGVDGLINRRNDGAIVRLITPASPNVESAKERLASFSQLLIPLMPQFLPQ